MKKFIDSPVRLVYNTQLIKHKIWMKNPGKEWRG
jgi:hypothetical protein